MFRFVQACLLAISVGTLLVGCGGNDFGPMGSISGKLTMDGRPLAAGTKVIFTQPTNGYTGFGLTDEAGQYRIEWRRSGETYDGLPVGNYQVVLVPADAIDVDDVSAEDMLAGGPKKSKGGGSIPPKFLRATTSGLVYDVAEGSNVIDIEAASKK